MEHLVILSFVFLNLFMVLGAVDLFYFHIWKYKLHTRPESRLEHKLHMAFAFLMVALALGEFLAGLLSKESWSWVAKESLVIGGWVALWRPLEIFLYDWWPIRAEARMYDRLGEMDVRLVDAAAPTAEAAA